MRKIATCLEQVAIFTIKNPGICLKIWRISHMKIEKTVI